MTRDTPLGGPPHLVLALDRGEAGTLLGVLAWVIGGLEIMRDRAEAVGEPALAEMHAELVPRLEALLSTMNAARQRSPLLAGGELEPEVEAAYAEVRRAFEAWIELTAFDTAQAAIADRAGAAAEEGTPSDDQ
jgi:hypothetical protein